MNFKVHKFFKKILFFFDVSIFFWFFRIFSDFFNIFSWFQVVILDYPSIICPGKQFVLHLQAIIEEVTLKAIICLVDKKTGEKQPRARFIKQDQHAIVRFQSEDIICMETFKDHPQLGRFTLRDEGKIFFCIFIFILLIYRFKQKSLVCPYLFGWALLSWWVNT